MDEDPLRRLCDVRRAIYSERDRRLAEAWKAPPKQESSLAILIREPSVPIERVADVLRAECAKRGRGKPGGAHWRWTKPHYLIAYFIEQSGAERTDGCISAWIDRVNGWAMMHNRKRSIHNLARATIRASENCCVDRNAGDSDRHNQRVENIYLNAGELPNRSSHDPRTAAIFRGVRWRTHGVQNLSSGRPSQQARQARHLQRWPNPFL